MENTNEKLTIKEKAKEIYRKNKPIINAVVIGVGAVGSWYIVKRLTKKTVKEVATNVDQEPWPMHWWAFPDESEEGGHYYLELYAKPGKPEKTLTDLRDYLTDETIKRIQEESTSVGEMGI